MLVKKDTVLKGEYQYEDEYNSFMVDKRILTIGLYASEDENPKYITEPGCFLLGRLSIKLPEGHVASYICNKICLYGQTKDEKKIKLAIKFGTTNLEVTATAVKTSVTASFVLSK